MWLKQILFLFLIYKQILFLFLISNQILFFFFNQILFLLFQPNTLYLYSTNNFLVELLSCRFAFVFWWANICICICVSICLHLYFDEQTFVFAFVFLFVCICILMNKEGVNEWMNLDDLLRITLKITTSISICTQFPNFWSLPDELLGKWGRGRNIVWCKFWSTLILIYLYLYLWMLFGELALFPILIFPPGEGGQKTENWSKNSTKNVYDSFGVHSSWLG